MIDSAFISGHGVELPRIEALPVTAVSGWISALHGAVAIGALAAMMQGRLAIPGTGRLIQGETMRPSDYGRLLALAAIWGASFLFMRIAAPAFGSINTTFLRVFFALVGLAAMLLLLRTPCSFTAS